VADSIEFRLHGQLQTAQTVDGKAKETGLTISWKMVQDAKKKYRVIEKTDSTSTTTNWMIANNDYKFMIFRLTESSPYRLASCEKTPTPDGFDTLTMHEISYITATRAAYSVCGVPLIDFFDNSKYRLISLRSKRDAALSDNELVAIEVEFVGSSTPIQSHGTIYSAVVDPTFHWALVKGRFSCRTARPAFP